MKIKKIVRSILFLSLFFGVLLFEASSSGQTIDSITVTPTSPGTDDKIKIDITGTVPDSCYEVESSSAGLDACGVKVSFLMSRRSGCFSFPPREVRWEKTARVDPLSKGTYVVAVELRDTEGTQRDAMTTSFFVLDYTDITDVQIVQIRSSMLTNLHVDEPLLLMVDAIGQEETTILYRFYYRFGYGTPAWEANSWETEQDWSPGNSVEYAFSEAGAYYVIAHVKAEGTDWMAGDPQGGFVVDVKE